MGEVAVELFQETPTAFLSVRRFVCGMSGSQHTVPSREITKDRVGAKKWKILQETWHGA